MQFVPLWDSILDNLKMHKLGPERFGRWCLVLVCAQRHDFYGGSLPDLETLAFWLRISEHEAGEWLADLVGAKLVDKTPEGHAIHDWQEWRCVKDKTSRERVKRHREKAKNSGGNGTAKPTCNGDVTDAKRSCNGVEASSDQRSLASASEEKTPAPARVAAASPEANAVIAVALERWGASNGDSVAGDLLRDYPPALVRMAMDRHWDSHKQDLRPAFLRGICRGLWKDGWPPPEVKRARPQSSGQADYRPRVVEASPLPSTRPAGPKISAAEAFKIMTGKEAKREGA